MLRGNSAEQREMPKMCIRDSHTSMLARPYRTLHGASAIQSSIFYSPLCFFKIKGDGRKGMAPDVRRTAARLRVLRRCRNPLILWKHLFSHCQINDKQSNERERPRYRIGEIEGCQCMVCLLYTS